MNKTVSVIMPSYNTADYISGSIRSVQSQTYEDWELIIVDDCSTDNTDEVVKPFLEDKRIRYFKNTVNSGAAVSRNYALRQAKGKWIAFLDSDDLWLPQKLEKQLYFMEKNRYAFTFTDYQIISPQGIKLPYVFTGPNKVTKRKLYNYCYFSTITVIYDSDVVGLIQISDIRKNNDYAMWFKAAEKTDCYRFPESLSIYCKHDNSISSGSKFKLIKYHYIMYRQALNKPVIISLLLTVNNLFFGVLKKIAYKKKIRGDI